MPQSFSAMMNLCQVVNERKCQTSKNQRKYDEAYGNGVTAIKNSDHDKFSKEVGTNFQLFITFGQQCTAVIEDEERRDVLVKGDLSSENMVVSLKSSLKSEPPMTILK